MTAPEPTTNITRLPTAAAEPVQQLPRKGRFPKEIGIYKVAERARRHAKWREEQKQRAINELDEAWTDALARLNWYEWQLKEMGAMPRLIRQRWT